MPNPSDRFLEREILHDALRLDYHAESWHFTVVSEGQAVTFLQSIRSVGRTGFPVGLTPVQQGPVLLLVNPWVGTEIHLGPATTVRYRDWFARLEKPNATFDLIAFHPDGALQDAVRVHVRQARILADPDITPVYVQCLVAVARVESIPPYMPPVHDWTSGV